jgi:hypothetical protein
MAQRYGRLSEKGHGFQPWWVPSESIPIRCTPDFRIERFCRNTWAFRIWYISHACYWFHARMRTRYMESVIYTSHLLTLRTSWWRRPGHMSQQLVCCTSVSFTIETWSWLNIDFDIFHCMAMESFANLRIILQKWKNSQHGTSRTFYRSVMLLKLPTCMVNVLSQCAMPVFEGLFPEDHDKIVQSLLYRFAQWHASPN